MKHIFLCLVLALGFTAVAPTSDADAWKRGGGDSGDSGGDSGWGDSGSGDSSGGKVPELSPTLAGSALVLLLGGVAYIASRRREDG